MVGIHTFPKGRRRAYTGPLLRARDIYLHERAYYPPHSFIPYTRTYLHMNASVSVYIVYKYVYFLPFSSPQALLVHNNTFAHPRRSPQRVCLKTSFGLNICKTQIIITRHFKTNLLKLISHPNGCLYIGGNVGLFGGSVFRISTATGYCDCVEIVCTKRT